MPTIRHPELDATVTVPTSTARVLARSGWVDADTPSTDTDLDELDAVDTDLDELDAVDTDLEERDALEDTDLDGPVED